MLVHISQEEFDDFMNEADTTPDVRAVQRQLDTAESVLDSFSATAWAKLPDHPVPKWVTELRLELENPTVLDGVELDS